MKLFGANKVHLPDEKLSCTEKRFAKNENDVQGSEDKLHSNENRDVAYRLYAKERYGVLDTAKCMRFLECVTKANRKKWLDVDGVYMGFRND